MGLRGGLGEDPAVRLDSRARARAAQEALGGIPRMTAARLDVGATGLGQRAGGATRLLTRSQIAGYLHGALSNCGRRHATAAKSPMRRGGVLSRLDPDAPPRVEKERVADVFVDPYPATSQR